jgi:hypothetical protein
MVGIDRRVVLCWTTEREFKTVVYVTPYVSRTCRKYSVSIPMAHILKYFRPWSCHLWCSLIIQCISNTTKMWEPRSYIREKIRSTSEGVYVICAACSCENGLVYIEGKRKHCLISECNTCIYEHNTCKEDGGIFICIISAKRWELL